MFALFYCPPKEKDDKSYCMGFFPSTTRRKSTVTFIICVPQLSLQTIVNFRRIQVLCLMSPAYGFRIQWAHKINAHVFEKHVAPFVITSHNKLLKFKSHRE